jgi:uncharacterized RDD family membrane protein YckC
MKGFAMTDTTYPDPALQSQFYAQVAPKRAMAWAIDTALTALLVALLIPLTGFLALFFLGGLYLVINFLYRWIGLARHSATLGMRIMGVEFRDDRGYRVAGGQAFAHTLFYALSVAFVIPQLISILMMCFTARGQGLSDVVLGTVLINARAMD